MIEYDDFLDTLQVLYNFDDSKELFTTLSVIAQLMLEIKDDRLSNATYIKDFKHDRLNIKVIVSRRYHND